MMLWRRQLPVAIEVMIACGVMLSVCDASTLLHINPSPFFVVVLYGAWMAGTLIGVLSGLLAAVLYLIILTVQAFPVAVFWTYISAEPAHYLTPMCLVIAGYTFGEIRTAWEGRLLHLRDQAQRAQHEAAAQRECLRVAEQTMQELQGRVLGQTATLTRLYGIARALNVLSMEQILSALMGIIEDLLQVEQASLYRVDEYGGAARLAVHVGEPAWEDAVTLSEHPCMSRLLAEERLLTLKDFTTRPAPVFLVPVWHQGQMYAIIAIHRLPVARVSSDTVQLLTVLAQWAGDALEGAAQYERVRQAAEMGAGPQVRRGGYVPDLWVAGQERYAAGRVPLTVCGSG